LAAGRGGKLKWYSSKVSEPWKNGDTLKFKIDTITNTLGFTIQGAGEKEVRTGWMFKNVLAFTNNRTYSDYMQVMAYCGGSSSNGLMNAKFDSVKLTLVETRRTQSVLNLDTSGTIEELEETLAEAMEADAAVAEAEADEEKKE
jgi:predicted lactoylglutathione lyase